MHGFAAGFVVGLAGVLTSGIVGAGILYGVIRSELERGPSSSTAPVASPPAQSRPAASAPKTVPYVPPARPSQGYTPPIMPEPAPADNPILRALEQQRQQELENRVRQLETERQWQQTFDTIQRSYDAFRMEPRLFDTRGSFP